MAGLPQMNEQTRSSALCVDIRQPLVVVPQAELQALTGPMAGGEQGLGFSDRPSSCCLTFLIKHLSGSVLTQLRRKRPCVGSGFSVGMQCFFTHLKDPLASVSPPFVLLEIDFYISFVTPTVGTLPPSAVSVLPA